MFGGSSIGCYSVVAVLSAFREGPRVGLGAGPESVVAHLAEVLAPYEICSHQQGSAMQPNALIRLPPTSNGNLIVFCKHAQWKGSEKYAQWKRANLVPKISAPIGAKKTNCRVGG